MEEPVKNNRFTELKKLKALKNYSDWQLNFDKSKFKISGDWLEDELLYKFLETNCINKEFLKLEDGVLLVDKLLVQFLLIDVLIHDELKSSSIEELNESLKGVSKIYKPLLNWNDAGIVVAYLQQMGLAKWSDYVLNANFERNDFNSLAKALSIIDVGAGDILFFLKKSQSNEASSNGAHNLSATLSEKLLNEPKLALEFEEQLDFIIEDEKLRKFLTSVIIGLSGNNGVYLEKFLSLLKDKYEGEILFQIFWGFIRCCPNSCRKMLEELMREKFVSKKLNKPQYLQLCGQFKIVSPEVSSLVVEPLIDEDFVGVYEYIYDLASTESNQEWFKDAALLIYTKNDEENRGKLEFLLYMLSEHNLNLVYELLTARFENLGTNLFLGENLDHIIDLDPELYHLNITKWFNSTNKNVHKALLKLCSGRDSGTVSKVSSEYFKSLSTENKVYVCYKIAGFIYSMEHLQSLLFSVLDASEPDEQILLSNLNQIFTEYLVYNYRSTLDIIRDKLNFESCLEHHKKFLQPIVDSFERYFDNLNKIRMFNEFRANSKLDEFLRFYKNQLFSASMKERNKTGFLSMIKSVNLQSKKWAIRRDNEKTHNVEHLGLIQHSFEFPSGEKLNPTYHETLRRNYQRIEKHEINFS